MPTDDAHPLAQSTTNLFIRWADTRNAWNQAFRSDYQSSDREVATIIPVSLSWPAIRPATQPEPGSKANTAQPRSAGGRVAVNAKNMF
jgi:hypothetical protein